MQVSVHHGPILIGTGILEHLDPPMGVAVGPFSPSVDYSADKHANTVDGEYVDDRGTSLTVSAVSRGVIETASIAIEDFADPEIGKHLTVWFKDERDYVSLFAEHPDYKAYYSSSR